MGSPNKQRAVGSSWQNYLQRHAAVKRETGESAATMLVFANAMEAAGHEYVEMHEKKQMNLRV